MKTVFVFKSTLRMIKEIYCYFTDTFIKGNLQTLQVEVTQFFTTERRQT